MNTLLSKEFIVTLYLTKLVTLLKSEKINIEFDGLDGEKKPLVLLEVYQNFCEILVAPNNDFSNLEEVRALGPQLMDFIEKLPNEVGECLKDFYNTTLNLFYH